MEAITGSIFAVFVVVPALWYARRFFREIKEDQRYHQDFVDDARRRKHRRQNWRRK